MERIPIRIRLSLGFVVVMMLLLAVVGLFFYNQLEDGLDNTIDRELAARLAGAIAIVRDDGDDLGDPVRDPLVRVDPGGYVQVLGPDGEVVGATSPLLLEQPLIGSGERGTVDPEVGTGTVRAKDVDVPNSELRLRVASAQARDDGVDYTVVAGASLRQRDETLTELRNLLWIGGPILLLLSSLAGYVLAAAALRPVERMRERAAALTGTEAGEKLPVNPANDEISRLGETLNGMLARVALAVDRERNFVADASHELRTPLTILRAELDLAARPGRSPEETEAAIVSALEETERLIALTDDLLVLSRADAGELHIQCQSLEVGESVGSVLDRLVPLLDEREVQVGVEGGTVLVWADPDRLGQVLYNLIVNAIEHTDSKVQVTATTQADGTEIVVDDDGPGFADELLQSGLDRFSRDRNASNSKGTGLGLAIVDQIVAAHGGRIEISNREVGGAEVRVWMPSNRTPIRAVQS